MKPINLSLAAAVQTQIHAEALLTYPHECCGALLGDWPTSSEPRINIFTAVALPNTETQRGQDRFVIDPKAYAKLEQQLSTPDDLLYGFSVVGFFHSHPDGKPVPSSIDLEMAQGLFEIARTFYIYAICAISNTKSASNEVKFWRLNPDLQAFSEVEFTTRKKHFSA